MRCRQLVMPLIAVGGLGLPTPAVAQYGVPVYPGPRGRVSLDAFVTSHFIETVDGSGRQAMGGAGGRLLYWLGEEPSSAGPRLGLGAFLVSTGHEGGDVDGSPSLRSEHFGAELDLRLPAAAARTVEPVLSLGVGAFRSRERWTTRERVGRVGADLAHRVGRTVDPIEVSWSSLALTPGVGARVRLSNGLWLRADLRDAVVFRGGARHYVEAIGGISLAR